MSDLEYLRSADFWLDPASWLLLILTSLIVLSFVIAWWFGLLMVVLVAGLLGFVIWVYT